MTTKPVKKTAASAEPEPEASTIPLPSWTDAASVTSYITSLVGAVFAVITALHPGYAEPVIVQVILPSVGAVVAGVAQIVNIVTHRSVQKAAVTGILLARRLG